MVLYCCIFENLDYDMYLRVFIFGVKVVSGYKLVKDIIYVINKVVDKINNDFCVNNKIKVVFLLNYCVFLVEKMIFVLDVFE